MGKTMDPGTKAALEEAAKADGSLDGVSSDVKLGVEAVRQWEEKVAHNLTALQRRTEDALDALRGVHAASKRLEQQANKMAQENANNGAANKTAAAGAGGDNSTAADTSANTSATVVAALGELVTMLGQRQNTLRASLAGPCISPLFRFNLSRFVAVLSPF